MLPLVWSADIVFFFNVFVIFAGTALMSIIFTVILFTAFVALKVVLEKYLSTTSNSTVNVLFV